MKAIQLVVDVQNLIDRYDINQVRSAIEFIESIANSGLEIKDGCGNSVMVTKQQHIAIAEHMRLGNKISAIKYLRDICPTLGLKMAKDMVEHSF